MNIEEIEGIADVYGHKLRALGVASVESLLDKGGKKAAREKLAEQTGINEHLILKWVNRADLMRIKGVGSEYSDLLEGAGVDSPLELQHRIPEHLYKKLEEVNEAKHLVRRLPTEGEVADWVKEAKALPRAVEH
jgi:predicted flap endonuclease-1-like 5' DNA nuclease